MSNCTTAPLSLFPLLLACTNFYTTDWINWVKDWNLLLLLLLLFCL